MVSLCSEKFSLLLFWSRLVHAALTMHATLAALGTIFQPSPALCSCEPRRPLGDMQAVSCGDRSKQYSRLLPASSSPTRSIVESAGSGPMGRVQYIIYMYIYFEVYIYYSRVATPPARRGGHRRPFFRYRLKGLLCGAGVEPPRGRGRPSGARESQVLFEYIITKTFSKIRLDITTTTEEHYILRIFICFPTQQTFVNRKHLI